ncbi:phospholipase D-like domain-containing protein [Actinokineospora diospyrosa]|uniref:phospholipase D n=1 Tax=Actinokineospora diospyrosa TaxID=103728 RepID=A0ABT1IC78_9PSEU|nr:phospholipase D-like domain-containing protein [Actinokineospora diospyrosa]MCP2270238.1 Phosphatidylserine/phosphatidylglycerophosphate/cardiolipin synthase [Actinokineospora diospyrosa]
MKVDRAKRSGLGRFLAAAVAAIAVCVTAAPTATADVATPVPVARKEVYNYTWFNTKADKDMHGGVSGHVRRLIDAASPGATLSLTLYFFNRQEIVDALARAAARSVTVRVVIDGGQTTAKHAQYQALKKIPTIKVVECGKHNPDTKSTACMGTRTGPSPLRNAPLMHNKFMTVSQVHLAGGGTASDIVYVSSANLDYYSAYENALTVSDAGIYRAYLGYFNDLLGYGKRGNDNYGKTISAGPHSLYTFPRRESGRNPGNATNDPIVSILRGTTCSGGTRIDLANFRIQRAAVVDELKAASKRGCQVRIVTGAKSGAPHDAGEPMVALVALARALPVHMCSIDKGGIPMHEKFMIVRRGTQSTLYTGSQNLTYQALRQNDENILALRNHPLNTPFQQRFDSHFATCVAWTPGPR